MSIYLERHGRGEPILLIHGTGSYSGAWDPVIGLLTDHAETIAFDLPGFGRSDPPSTPARDMQTLTDQVEAFMDAQDLDTAHLAGNSGGAWLALELAKRGRARTVVALGPMGLWRPTRNGQLPGLRALQFPRLLPRRERAAPLARADPEHPGRAHADDGPGHGPPVGDDL